MKPESRLNKDTETAKDELAMAALGVSWTVNCGTEALDTSSMQQHPPPGWHAAWQRALLGQGNTWRPGRETYDVATDIPPHLGPCHHDRAKHPDDKDEEEEITRCVLELYQKV